MTGHDQHLWQELTIASVGGWEGGGGQTQTLLVLQRYDLCMAIQISSIIQWHQESVLVVSAASICPV